MAKNTKVWTHRIEYAGFRAAEALTRSMPLETASDLSGRLWRRLGPSSRRHTRALENLAQSFPDKSPAERAAIAADMWDMLGRTFVETFRMNEIVDSDRLQIADEAGLRARLRAGCVVCAAHFGNWEIGAGALSKAGGTVAGVYQRLSNPRVGERLYELRSQHYAAGLFPKAPSTSMKVFRAVRRGANFAMLADQRDENGIRAPFFGVPAPTSFFPALIARRLNRPLVVGSLLRRPGVRFLARWEDIPTPQTNDIDDDVTKATIAVQNRFENWIRDDPGQWMWTHRRWG